MGGGGTGSGGGEGDEDGGEGDGTVAHGFLRSVSGGRTGRGAPEFTVGRQEGNGPGIRSIFAARMKSFSVSPPTAWVQISTSTVE